MQKIIYTLACLMLVTIAHAQHKKTAVKQKEEPVDIFARHLNRYSREIDSLARLRDSIATVPVPESTVSAYSMKLFLPPTFYCASVLRQFSPDCDSTATDINLLRTQMTDNTLSAVYVCSPWLVQQTDSQVSSYGVVRSDVENTLASDVLLSSGIDSIGLPSLLDSSAPVLYVRKPKFWTFSGSGSLQFTQSHFSSNWYQGGDDNYAGLALITLNANFDDKRKIQWENTLDLQLGFQTNESDTHHKFKATSNLVRLNTKFGYKAFKHFYYTSQVRAQTQLVPLYDNNSTEVKTSFLNPLNVAVSVGLDYKFSTWKGRFSGNVYLAPCSYDLKYVSDVDLATRYGIDENCHAFHNFGPSASINWELKPWTNISWKSRMYWISDFTYTNIEWENTITFTINKFITSQLFLYPKFDDSSEDYRSDSSGCLMFKEWLSLGLSYKF